MYNNHMLNLNTPLEKLTGIGPKLSEKLSSLNLHTCEELFYYFPRKFMDFRALTPITWAHLGEEGTFKGRLSEIKFERTKLKHMALVTAHLTDDTGSIKVIWFNQGYLAHVLRPNLPVTVYGKVEFRLREKVLSSPIIVKDEKIVPVYSESAGIFSRVFERIISQILPSADQITDWLPDNIKEKEDLIDLSEALRQIHAPSSFEAIAAAKERLAFDELFLIALSLIVTKQQYQKDAAFSINIDTEILKKFTSKLPFTLTPAQKKSAWEIIQDLAKSHPMNRLLEGDVGSGKTVVAALAALAVVKSGYQVAWLAPTEILANQHYQNITNLVAPFDIKVALVTGSIKHDHKTAEIAIGTHALIQENIHFPKLGLVIVDEQHRFGVAQRATLRAKHLKMPHLLSMTATPIPRTLALALYGDLDISLIDEMPAERQKIITKIVPPESRTKAYDFIRAQIASGRQCFVVCPLIDAGQSNASREKEQLDLFEAEKRTAVKEYDKLSKEIFPDLKIGLLHGRLKSKQKEAVMSAFVKGEINILVSTAVIEVGIDIPNATVMMIEGAERFGLAQLHQFRGRVGRGAHQSYCFLFTDSWSENTKIRLDAMTETSNGFALAERDLALRGPGELAGIRQSGLPDLKMASLTDIIMIRRARASAEMIIHAGLQNYPVLQARLQQFYQSRHLE